MQSGDRIAKGIADILDARAEMWKILSPGREAFLGDRRNTLAVRYLLIEAVEAIADICQHLLAKKQGVACSGYVDCIVKAGENDIIRPELAAKLRRLADLRNSLIHRYWIISDEELFGLCSANIGDFDEFCRQVRTQSDPT